jgi:hypothetical protein
MKLRFEVDQAECFRKGIDCPKSVVTIEVNPSDIPQEERNLIADRLDGIDVCEITAAGTIKVQGRPVLVLAKDPSYQGLIEAVRANQAEVERQQKERIAAQGMAADLLDAISTRVPKE